VKYLQLFCIICVAYAVILVTHTLSSVLRVITLFAGPMYMLIIFVTYQVYYS